MLKSVALSALALSLAACATQPPAPTPTTTAAAKTGCVPETASRIVSKDGSFCSGFGSTHSKQDIDSTGQQDLSRALPMLDPTVTRTGSH